MSAGPFKLDAMPGRDEDGLPNRAARLLSRREHLQLMMHDARVCADARAACCPAW